MDQREFNFTTFDVKIWQGAQGGEGSGLGDFIDQPGGGDGSCGCSSWLDLLCFFLKVSSIKLGMLFGDVCIYFNLGIIVHCQHF